MSKVEMRVTIKPGEIKELVGDDGSVTIEGIDDPEFIKILHAMDRFYAMRSLQRPFNHSLDAVEIQMKNVFDNISPRLKRLLREHPLVG